MARSVRIRLILAALITILVVATVLALFDRYELPPFFAAVTAFAVVLTFAGGTCLALLPKPDAWPEDAAFAMPLPLPAGNHNQTRTVPTFLDAPAIEIHAPGAPELPPEPAPMPAISAALREIDAEPAATELLDLRWAQLGSPHARRLLLAAAECRPDQPIPHRLLQRATRLPPEAYRAACDLLCDLGLLQCDDAGPVIAAQVADRARRAATIHHAPLCLPAVARAAIHLTTGALLGSTAPPAASCPQPAPHQLCVHARFLAAATLAAGLPEARTLWYNLACHWLLTGNHRAAAEALLQVANLDAERDGFHHPAVAAGLLDLGLELQTLRLPEAAALALGRAVPLLSHTYGPHHPRTEAARATLDILSRHS
jgi:hypothetical protein